MMTHQVNKYISPVLLLLLGIALVPQMAGASASFGPAEPTLYLDPPQAIVGAGQDTEMAVKVRGINGSGIYGIQLILTFDAAQVQVVDRDPAQEGVQVQFPASTSFEGLKYFVGRNLVDNEAGKIEFTVTLQQPSPPLQDEGILFIIKWHAQTDGWSQIDFAEGKLVDKDGQILNVATEHGFIGASALLPVTGQVKLQGRHDGQLGQTLVTLSANPCLPSLPYSISNAQGKVLSTDVTVKSDTPHTYTDEHGRFSLVPFQGQTYQCLLVYQVGYLVGEHPISSGWFKTPEQADLGTITLLGGDVTHDDVINIFDLTKVASHMSPDSYDGQVDINADGQVDISDLAITAGNFGLCGPLSKWSF